MMRQLAKLFAFARGNSRGFVRLGRGMFLAGLLLTTLAGEDSRFGVMTHFAQGWPSAMVPEIAAAGTLRVRDELYWDEIETQKGVYKFPVSYDQYMNALAANGVSPLIVLSFENRNYDGGLTPYTADGFAAYARYAVQVLRHYGTRIKTVEIWNEYNGSFNRGPASVDRAATYLKMLKVAYAAIKAERPDVTVLAGGTAGVPFPYWEKLLEGGVLNYADGLSIHPYRYTERPEGMEVEISNFRRLIERYGNVKPIWATEIGWQLKDSKAVGDFAIDEDVQARFLVRAYALLMSAGVENSYWYLFRDDQEFTMGLVKNDDARTPKLAYKAMTTLNKHLEGATFVKREATPEDMYSFLFRTATGGEKRIVWQHGSNAVPLRGAVSATTIYGKSVSVSGSAQITYTPLFVNGPLRGLPSATTLPAKLGDSLQDFLFPTNSAWTYGYLPAGAQVFTPLPTFESTDWEARWSGPFPFISVSATGQHPSYMGSLPVAAVRRWVSRQSGRVRIVGSFTCGTDGDGVGVSVLVNGEKRFRKLLGRMTGVGVVYDFDLTENVNSGSSIDFAVDPGPGTNIDFDATRVSVVIRPAA